MFYFGQLTAVILGTLLFAVSHTYAATPQGYVYDVRGDVQARIGAGTTVPVEKNQNLGNNTAIITGPKSSAVLKFIDGTVIALNENTSFLIQKYNYDEKSPSTVSALFSMLRGGLRALTGAISSRNPDGFKLATPTATIGIRGTEFMAQMVNPLYLQVIGGNIVVTNAAGTVVFTVGQTAIVSSATTLATAIPAVPAGTFGGLPGMSLPPPVPTPTVPVPGAATVGSSAAGAAAGGIGGVGVGAAAAAAAAAAALTGSDNPTSGTTSGTTTGTR